MNTLLLILLLCNQSADSIFEKGSKLTKLGPPDSAGEGPAWHPTLGILTSGHKGIHRLDPKGVASIHVENALTNGLLFSPKGDLLACQPGKKRVVQFDSSGNAKVLADKFNGFAFNQPNDLSLDDAGRLYFSDPRYGPKDGMEQKDEKGNTIEGVYRIDPDGKIHRVVAREVERANGVLVSKDGKWLYVADNNNDVKNGARKLWRFPRNTDGAINTKQQELIYDWKQGRGPDGLKEDIAGNLYVAGGLNKPNPPFEPDADIKGGIYAINPNLEMSKRLITFLPIPTDEVTNCAFGGSDKKTLYITGGGTLYSIRTINPGFVRFP